ncbi:MAG: hypothetical protein F6K18_30685 [Okeania sp. SIO2C2]|uniref:hypothetical protein n=1 Tax=Okeania sp. SIO2C2 TaxID=2607787 RepID=UPI0013BDD150|nr:hypothetical protein [Okeania sp. SIO2C2]NEP90823.1 hypothetical protein [Okeania sp. SIO2C2]
MGSIAEGRDKREEVRGKTEEVISCSPSGGATLTVEYLGFAEKVLWVRVGDNPPLAPPPTVEGKTGEKGRERGGRS